MSRWAAVLVVLSCLAEGRMRGSSEGSWPFRCEASTNSSAISSLVDLSGKTVVVTGADGGLGHQISKAVVAANGSVMMACRNATKCAKTRAMIEEELGIGNDTGRVGVTLIDLSVMEQVVAGARAILARHPVIDVVVQNAGTSRGGMTRDGFVLSMQVDHFAPALLSDLLLPGLQRARENGSPGRVVNVGSGNAYDVLSPKLFPQYSSLDELMRWARNSSGLTPFQYYAIAKFLQIHHAREFNRRHSPKVLAFSVNPGFARPDARTLPAWEQKQDREACSEVFEFRPCPLSYAQGATGIVFAALMPGIERAAGALFDYETLLNSTGASFMKQRGPSCVPRPFPFWSAANASAWFEMVEDAIEPWKRSSHVIV